VIHWLLGVYLAAAPAGGVVIVADSSAAPYQRAVDALRQQSGQVELLQIDDPALDERLTRSAEVWVALGARSARRLAQSQVPNAAAMLLQATDVPEGIAAVTLDVPAYKQLLWIRTAFTQRRRVVVLRQRSGPVQEAPVLAAANKLQLTVHWVEIDSPGEAVPALEKALRGHGRDSVLWLVPDPVAVNSDTVSPLAQAALAARVPVVGFSPYFLQIGALAAVKIDSTDAARQALRLAKSGTAKVVPPDAAHLVVDGRLAERLGIAVQAGEGVEVRR